MSIFRNEHQSLSQMEGRWKSMLILSFQSDFLKTDLNSNAGAEDRGESGSSWHLWSSPHVSLFFCTVQFVLTWDTTQSRYLAEIIPPADTAVEAFETVVDEEEEEAEVGIMSSTFQIKKELDNSKLGSTQ